MGKPKQTMNTTSCIQNLISEEVTVTFDRPSPPSPLLPTREAYVMYGHGYDFSTRKRGREEHTPKQQKLVAITCVKCECTFSLKPQEKAWFNKRRASNGHKLQPPKPVQSAVVADQQRL